MDIPRLHELCLIRTLVRESDDLAWPHSRLNLEIQRLFLILTLFPGAGFTGRGHPLPLPCAGITWPTHEDIHTRPHHHHLLLYSGPAATTTGLVGICPRPFTALTELLALELNTDLLAVVIVP